MIDFFFVIVLLLQEVPQVEKGSIVLRVGVKCSPVVFLSLLRRVCKSSQIVQGTCMSRIKSEETETENIQYAWCKSSHCWEVFVSQGESNLKAVL